MMSTLLSKIERGLKKPPSYILERLGQELRGQAERYLAPARVAGIRPAGLAKQAGHRDVESWWVALGKRPYFAQTRMDLAGLEALCPGDAATILADAELALARQVDLLGSGPVRLGNPICWNQDYKTGISWPNAYCRDIEYSNLDKPSDVKFPWEVSRMQWLIPAAQAFALTGEERYAEFVRSSIEGWISANPYAGSVNWACTMDVAIRAMTWTYFFHVFHASEAWADVEFQGNFLRNLWLAGDFIERHLEKSDINGNHYTADAAGLVFVGLFFGGTGVPSRWEKLGFQILQDELPRQVFEDGVDFEASVPYHRLVQELFLYPALYRKALGFGLPEAYRERLLAMAEFTTAYSRPDGSVPLWGDADDARALPFRQKPINDHRYLIAVAGVGLSEPDLVAKFSGPRSELAWMFGIGVAAELADQTAAASPATSKAFMDGGFYVLRNQRDHVFVDCGPLGLGGRGGHGHNDLLSFEAWLNGTPLVSDCGSYLYTANWRERNNFRSTSYHNTPQIDGEEINRFVRPDYLWTLHNDAQHDVIEFTTGRNEDRLVVRHDGYSRLREPVRVKRTFRLNHDCHALTITDEFLGEGEHTIETPLHLAIGARAVASDDGALLTNDGQRFLMQLQAGSGWSLRIEPARVSPSYGVAIDTQKLVLSRRGPLKPVTFTLRSA